MKVIAKIVFRLYKDGYSQFIKKLRRASSSDMVLGGRGVTWPPPTEVKDTNFIDVFLYCGIKGTNYDRGIRLRIKAHDLYCVGFKKCIESGKWYSLSMENDTLYIPGSNATRLPFGENYNDMGGCTQGSIGAYAVEAAINGILNTEDPEKMKKPLVTLLLFTSEAVRSPDISREIKTRLDTNDNSRVPGEWKNIINGWRTRTKHFVVAYYKDIGASPPSASVSSSSSSIATSSSSGGATTSRPLSRGGAVRVVVRGAGRGAGRGASRGAGSGVENVPIEEVNYPEEIEEDTDSTDSGSTVDDDPEALLTGPTLSLRRTLGVLLFSATVQALDFM